MLILKGFIIGVAKIIPGLSGAVLAISLGVYEKAINAISNIHKDYKNIIYLAKLGFGVLLAVVLMSKIILYLLNSYYLLTMLLFVGFISGGIKSVKNNITKLNLIVFILSFIFVYSLSLIGKQNFFINVTGIYEVIANMFIGFIDALTMIIPGISGTAVMMILGCYDKYIHLISEVNIIKLIPFIISLSLSIMVLSKFMSYLFIKHKNVTYSMVLGFSLSSVIYLSINVLQKTSSLIELGIGIILFILGYLISLKLEA